MFALESNALWKDVTWTTISGTAAYSLASASVDASSNFIFEDFVLYKGYELSPISRHELQRLSPGRDWTTDEGTPTHFILDPNEALKQIRLYPIPQEAVTLTLRYYCLPDSLSSDSDTPLNSSSLLIQYHTAIAAYAAWLMLLGEDTTPAIVMKRKELIGIYVTGRDLAIDKFKNTASMPLKIKGSRIWK